MSAPTFSWAIEQGRVRRLPTSARIVLLVLADRANGVRQAWPSQETIANDTGLTDRWVRSATKMLEGAGLIRRERRGKHWLYHVLRPLNGEDHSPALSAASAPEVSSSVRRTAEVSSAMTAEVSSGVHRTTPEVSSTTPEPSSAKYRNPVPPNLKLNQEENLKSKEGEIKLPEQEARAAAPVPPKAPTIGSTDSSSPPANALRPPDPFADGGVATAVAVAAEVVLAEPDDTVGPKATGAVIHGLGRSMRNFAILPGPKDDRQTQINAMANVMPLLRPQPQEPEIDAAAQAAAVLAACTTEQIERAKQAFAQRAAR